MVRTSQSEGCIDTCLAFGASPSAGVYGHVADAAAEIFRHHGIGPLDKWVDDHIFFRVKREHIMDYNKARSGWHQQILTGGPQRNGGRIWFEGHATADGNTEEFNEDCSAPIQDLSHISPRCKHNATFSYSLTDIDRLSEILGIPWETSKDQPFGPTTTYIGFVWDLKERTVKLSQEKADKYLRAIEEWQSCPTHRLDEVQKLYGKLLHTASLIPAGRAYLTGLERMLAVCSKKPFMPHRPDKAISDDLTWWHRAIKNGMAIRSIFPPPPRADHQAFSDASSSIGIGIVIGKRWRAWCLVPGWQTLNGKRDIAWAEAIGFEFLLLALASGVNSPQHITIYGDNTSVIESWRVGRHRNKLINEVFRRIHAFLADRSSNVISVHAMFVPSGHNPADGPSRGIYPPAELLLPPVAVPQHLQRFLVDCTSPLTSAELRALQEGRYTNPATKLIDRIKRKQEVDQRLLSDQRRDDLAIRESLTRD